MSETWIEWGVEHVLRPTSKDPKTVVVPADTRQVAENLAELGASEFVPAAVVCRTVSAGEWTHRIEEGQ
ncbi:hypothetical protein KHQ84_gp125 [Rhodococcus phage Finch]|uniref:Uncharacterized protein n=1 Tax=Rhodococcus phage Finch TaxID=2094144 RepID=A0A2P1JXJ0_9CAUD|nr:hypothetical protein KHQ84_gp125 [Rhodococcus phage Finch]AVO25056.1 hypothetical protein SEA_FINCH_125 [Rhodococcus phage Finch]